TRYLEMVYRAAAGFASVPGVIGYDLLNEPWGDERSQIAPLYRDEARAIHEAHPSAILLVEGHIATNCGFQTRLPRPEFGQAVYAPTSYSPTTSAWGGWPGARLGLSRAFSAMADTAREWQTPLFIGEFGISAEIGGGGNYVRTFYDRLDAALASGAQWDYTPRWNAETQDRWNGEEFSILQPSGPPRTNFQPPPHPRAPPWGSHYAAAPPAGGPPALGSGGHTARPWGEPELSRPAAPFPAGSDIDVKGAGVSCRHDPRRQILACRSPVAGTVR